MLVRELMSKKLVTVDADISMIKASRLMKDNGIQHLLVLKTGRLAGIVSDRDLKETQRSKATPLDIHELYYLLDNITLGSVTPRQLFTIHLAPPWETLRPSCSSTTSRPCRSQPGWRSGGDHHQRGYLPGLRLHLRDSSWRFGLGFRVGRPAGIHQRGY